MARTTKSKSAASTSATPASHRPDHDPSPSPTSRSVSTVDMVEAIRLDFAANGGQAKTLVHRPEPQHRHDTRTKDNKLPVYDYSISVSNNMDQNTVDKRNQAIFEKRAATAKTNGKRMFGGERGKEKALEMRKFYYSKRKVIQEERDRVKAEADEKLKREALEEKARDDKEMGIIRKGKGSQELRWKDDG